MIALDESQERARQAVSSNKKLTIITGGPGFGKTFTIRAILDDIFAVSRPENVYLACPTGKAAKVLADALGVSLENEPSTVHRMLGCRGPQWEFNEHNKLKAEWIILDESSMVDAMLMARIIRSVSDDCRFILVGDKDQLPPVGAGCPFRDIISAGLEDTVFRLEINHRQQEGSLIAHGCSKIIAGEKPVFGKADTYTLGGARWDDLYFVEKEDKEDIPVTVAAIVEEWNDAGDDYCVLAPQKTGKCGVDALNLFLQEHLNPARTGRNQIKGNYGVVLREGDKVMHTRNNYTLGVFNGFTGVIRSIDEEYGAIVVDYDGEDVTYSEKADINELVLGYCISVHKSQGSQYKYGVVACHSSHYYMWSRQLLYTAMSRFKEQLYVVGDNKAIKRAVSNSVDNSRQTYLSLALGN